MTIVTSNTKQKQAKQPALSAEKGFYRTVSNGVVLEQSAMFSEADKAFKKCSSACRLEQVKGTIISCVASKAASSGGTIGDGVLRNGYELKQTN